MKQFLGKKLGTKYGFESVIVYGAGQTIGVDRTHAGLAWCKSRGMSPAYTVTAGNEVFTVLKGMINCSIGGTMEAACAIPGILEA